MPAKAGIQGSVLRMRPWAPASAGVTILQSDATATFANLHNVVTSDGTWRKCTASLQSIRARRLRELSEEDQTECDTLLSTAPPHTTVSVIGTFRCTRM